MLLFGPEKDNYMVKNMFDIKLNPFTERNTSQEKESIRYPLPGKLLGGNTMVFTRKASETYEIRWPHAEI